MPGRSSPLTSARLVTVLTTLFPSVAMFPEVSSSTGAQRQGTRRADTIGVETLGHGPLVIHGFEAKASKKDLVNELRHPEKSAQIAQWCSFWWLVLVAPWKHLLDSLHDVPRGWGAIEVDGSKARILVQAPERGASEPSADFLRGIFRVAGRAEDEATAGGIPNVAVQRWLPGGQAWLACGHLVPVQTKQKPPRLPCFACADEAPIAVEIVESLIVEAPEEDRVRFARLAGGGR